MAAANALGPQLELATGARVGDFVGKMRPCRDPTKMVFDMPADIAAQLIAAAEAYVPGSDGGVGSDGDGDGDGDGEAEEHGPGGGGVGRQSLMQLGLVQLAACTELPELRPMDGGRDGGRGGGTDFPSRSTCTPRPGPLSFRARV